MLPKQGLAHKTTTLTLLALPWYPMFKASIGQGKTHTATVQHEDCF